MSSSKLPAVFIGLRYLLAKRDNRFISFTSLVSMAGLTLGVLALVIVLSVFNGSQGLMRDRTLITVPHADIAATPAFAGGQQAIPLLERLSGVEAVSPYTRIEALVSQQGYHQVTQIRGILPDAETRTSPLPAAMIEGSIDDLQPGQRGIVIGRTLANNLRVWIGDSLNLVVPQSNSAGNRVQLGMHRFTVVGVFDVQFDIGSSLAYIHLQDSEGLLGSMALDSAVHLRLKTSDINAANARVAEALNVLQRELPGSAG